MLLTFPPGGPSRTVRRQNDGCGVPHSGIREDRRGLSVFKMSVAGSQTPKSRQASLAQTLAAYRSYARWPCTTLRGFREASLLHQGVDASGMPACLCRAGQGLLPSLPSPPLARIGDKVARRATPWNLKPTKHRAVAGFRWGRQRLEC